MPSLGLSAGVLLLVPEWQWSCTAHTAAAEGAAESWCTLAISLPVNAMLL